MKITTILLFSISLTVTAGGFAQNVTISADNMKLEKVFKEIKKQTGYVFFYDAAILQDAKPVSIHVKDKFIEDVLKQSLEGQLLDFSIEKKTITIFKSIGRLLNGVEGRTSSLTTSTQQPLAVITGIIKDAQGNPLGDVSVVVIGTKKGATTGKDGSFSIDANVGDVLEFSMVGYKKKSVIVGQSKNLSVIMEIEVSTGNEIVVVGYGTTKKATLTGAVASVKGAEIKESPAFNVGNSMAGRVAGMTVVTPSGEPGADASVIRIRGINTLGDNSPLVVVDGIMGRSLDRINPADIESITVLKDASAAIYGSRAANGVILVTTKRGTSGKPELSLNFNQGFSTPTILPKMADAATYATMINEVNEYRGYPHVYTDEMIEKYKQGTDPWGYPNTDWFRAVYKDYSSQNMANASLSGGSDKVKYYVSFGSKYQDGNYKRSGTNYRQYNFQSNIDGKINDNIRISVDINGRQEDRQYPTKSSSLIFASTLRGKPNINAYWPNGLPGPDIERGENPAVMATDATGYDRQKSYYLQTNVKVNINIPWVQGLSLLANASYDKSINNRKIWQTPWTLYYWDGSYDGNNQPVLSGGPRGYSEPRLTQSMLDGKQSTLNAMVNYEKTIADKHYFKILAGAEQITGDAMNFSAFRRYFISSTIDQLYAGGDLDKDNTGSANGSARLNYFGRFNYNYKEKYLAEFVFRYDGSYIFKEDRRFGFFPGVSLGWNISNESFWKDNISFIKYLKIRGSWGQTGNDLIDPYQFLASYGLSTSRTYVFNNSVEKKILQELRIPNPNVTWEVANQSNIGLDGQLMDGHIRFAFDYFYNIRTNILHYRNASVPETSGLTLPRENIGEVVNRGVEFELGYNNKISEFKYSISVNGGFQKNKIRFWDETPGAPEYQKSTGRPINADLYYQVIGVFKDQADVNARPHWDGARPGDLIFEDVNKDGIINGLDQVRMDKTDIPTFTGGANVNLSYKGLYANVFLQGATGAARRQFTWSGEVGNYLERDALGRWTSDNTDAAKPRAWNWTEDYWTNNNNNTYYLRNNNYLRVKTIEVGYNFPYKLLNKWKVDALRFYVSGYNLITFTGLKDFDPETPTTVSYPPSKIVNAGINITF